MKLEFIPIDYSAFDFEGRNYVKIVGRSSAGKRVCVVDDYHANFWAILKKGVSAGRVRKIVKEIKSISVEKAGRHTKVERVEVKKKNFLGKKVDALRVFVSNHKDAYLVTDRMKELGLEEVEHKREKDLNVVTKYIKEKGVAPLCWYAVEGEEISGSSDFGGVASVLDVDVCVRAEKISGGRDRDFSPRILAYDIEVDDFEIGKGEILMISLYGKGLKKVLTWKACKRKQNFVECFEDEAEMLEAFVKYVKDYGADMLVGYFSDGFDLPYLRSVAGRNKVKLALGLDGSQPTFKRGFIPAGRIEGIVHVDLLRFIQTVYAQYLKSETLSLNEVAGELLGERKLDFDFDKLGKMKDGDWRDFFVYNLQDSLLTYKLAERLWPDMLEFSKIIKEPLFEIVRDTMASHVEDYIIHNLDKFDEIAEKRPLHEEIGERRRRGKYEGAFVFQPEPGLYNNIVFFDFTSMYASVIVSYNLSLSTFEKAKKDGKDMKFEFSKKEGFFPLLLREIIEKRKKYKKEYAKDKNNLKRARSNAYKLLANAAYGYQGFFGARYYCVEAAAATAAFARENILNAIEKIKRSGYKIVYSDTDSIAFLQGGKSKKEVLKMLDGINKNLPGIMELELEDFYKRGLFVSKRSTQGGAKKKYALISEDGKVKIRGFETVRRDWCRLARDLQNKVIALVLKDGNEQGALKLVKEVVEKVKKREIELKDLIIKTQLKKGIRDYVAKGPHVVAAEKMEALGVPVDVGMVIEYYVAEGSGKRVGDRVKLPSEKGRYDVGYYLKNQIGAAVENILEVFGVGMGEVIEGCRQKRLF